MQSREMLRYVCSVSFSCIFVHFFSLSTVSKLLLCELFALVLPKVFISYYAYWKQIFILVPSFQPLSTPAWNLLSWQWGHFLSLLNSTVGKSSAARGNLQRCCHGDQSCMPVAHGNSKRNSVRVWSGKCHRRKTGRCPENWLLVGAREEKLNC